VHYELAARALELGWPVRARQRRARSQPELDFIEIAIAPTARLAGIPQERIVNYWPEKKFLDWARERGTR
jgi:hypothetical protein